MFNKITTVLCFALLSGCQSLPVDTINESASQEQNNDNDDSSYFQIANVTKNNNVISFDGGMSFEANEQVKKLIDSQTTSLQIRSRGGEINAGMELAELIYKHKLNVEVKDYCFSSCANYVFPAGKTKVLSANSLLGWHGGALQEDDDFEELLSPEEQKAFESYIVAAREREKRLFRDIGVKQSITILGQSDKYDRYQDCIGWNYSLAALDKLGVKNIKLKDGEWQPATSFNDNCLFTIGEQEL
ncbi:hypothetical protein [Photobacterium sanguinicancri]|uniref:hypothetical protein n=1 Tax=Photobacterium sanguinicancri TaxID=875932 RepID=UPI0026E1428A|nr:hypothetical protein [Photobacterium sanguinicancri]MDO6497920.1 hypothetical protein [Photobacterium sanguinicancri]